MWKSLKSTTASALITTTSTKWKICVDWWGMLTRQSPTLYTLINIVSKEDFGLTSKEMYKLIDIKYRTTDWTKVEEIKRYNRYVRNLRRMLNE